MWNKLQALENYVDFQLQPCRWRFMLKSDCNGVITDKKCNICLPTEGKHEFIALL